jgi:hypothetical protein
MIIVNPMGWYLPLVVERRESDMKNEDNDDI